MSASVHGDATTPEVSVVMPCFNGERYLEEAIRSVLDQTLREVELIVVDDGSKDSSPAIVARLQQVYGDRLVGVAQPNAGPYAARNRGLQMARGRFVAFLDSDDWWAPDCLQKLHAALVADDGAALAYCGWQNIGLEGGRGAPYVPPDYELEDKAARFLRAAAPWPIHAALVRRSVMREVGLFDLDLPTCMDYDLWLRLATGHRVLRVPNVLAFYHHHGGEQITRNRTRLAMNHWRAQRNYLTAHPDAAAHLGRRRLRELTAGELLHRGYVAYWQRDLGAARAIFRAVMKLGYGGPKDWAYMLPSWLPESWHRTLLRLRDTSATAGQRPS